MAEKTIKSKVWIYSKKVEGKITPDVFKCYGEELPELNDGEVLFETQYLTVDPGIRPLLDKSDEGAIVNGLQLAKVLRSKNEAYQVGNNYTVLKGWRTHTIINPEKEPRNFVRPVPEIDTKKHKASLALGPAGMTGVVGYQAVNMCNVKKGDIVLVSAAAGAVGNVAGQIAKMMGGIVIGSVGSKDKVEWLKKIGFDHVFNYKKEDMTEVLLKVAPDGIDHFIDGVGGIIGETGVKAVKAGGNYVTLGYIANYDAPDETKKIEKRDDINNLGFMVYNISQECWDYAINNLTKWINEGKLQYKETVYKGFDKVPRAFCDLFTHTIIGKAIIKV